MMIQNTHSRTSLVYIVEDFALATQTQTSDAPASQRRVTAPHATDARALETLNAPASLFCTRLQQHSCFDACVGRALFSFPTPFLSISLGAPQINPVAAHKAAESTPVTATSLWRAHALFYFRGLSSTFDGLHTHTHATLNTSPPYAALATAAFARSTTHHPRPPARMTLCFIFVARDLYKELLNKKTAHSIKKTNKKKACVERSGVAISSKRTLC